MTKKTELATGNVAHWKYGTVRIQISMPESAFTDLKMAALKNGNSLSKEALQRLVLSFELDCSGSVTSVENIFAES